MFFLYSLQGLTPLPIELPPSYLGLLNSAHLRFAIQLDKLELGGNNRQGTNYDRQVVEHGDCVAYSVAGATVHAPVFASRYARLLRRDRPRLKARAVAESKFNHYAGKARETYKFVNRNSYFHKL